MKASMQKNGLILGAFALVTTGLISLTFMGTKDKIAEQQQLKLLNDLAAVIPQSLYNNDIQHDCIIVSDQALLNSPDATHIYRARLNEQTSAVAIETTAPNGYSGKIKLLVGITTQAEISGVRVLQHKETPGLGDKIDIRISDWILNFNGHSYLAEHAQKWNVRKDGGQFDQFTGATITPRAVIHAVKNALIYYQQNQSSILKAENACNTEQTLQAS